MSLKPIADLPGASSVSDDDLIPISQTVSGQKITKNVRVGTLGSKFRTESGEDLKNLAYMSLQDLELGKLAHMDELQLSDIPQLDMGKIDGLGRLSKRDFITERDISGKISCDFIAGLGELSRKDSLSVSDIPELTHEKISDIGLLALKDQLSSSDIPQIPYSKVTGLKGLALSSVEDLNLANLSGEIVEKLSGSTFRFEYLGKSQRLVLHDHSLMSCEVEGDEVQFDFPQVSESAPPREFYLTLENVGNVWTATSFIFASSDSGITFLTDQTDALKHVQPKTKYLYRFTELSRGTFYVTRVTLTETAPAKSTKLTITFQYVDSDDEEVKVAADQVVSVYDGYSFTVLQPSGIPDTHEFVGWFLSDGTAVSIGQRITPTSDMTITGKCLRYPRYMLTFAVVEDGVSTTIAQYSKYKDVLYRNMSEFLDDVTLASWEEVDGIAMPRSDRVGYDLIWKPDSAPKMEEIGSDIDFVGTYVKKSFIMIEPGEDIEIVDVGSNGGETVLTDDESENVILLGLDENTETDDEVALVPVDEVPEDEESTYINLQ